MKKTYALVGASAAIGAAIGPLIGGFVTTYLSWRVGFLMEAVIIAIVLANIKLVRDVAYTGLRKIDTVGAALSIVGMGGIVLGILVWQEGGEFVLLIMAIGAVALAALAYWLVRRKREGKVALLDPSLFKVPNFRVGVSQMVLQQITLGGAMIAIPLYLQVTLEYTAMQAGLSLAPLSLTMFAVALLAGKKAGNRRPASIIRLGFGLAFLGMLLIIPVIPRGESGWALLVPLVIAGTGLGLLVSQLNNYILAPIEEERVSEAAGVNSAGQSFGLSFGLALAGGILLAALSLSFVDMTEASDVIPPADQEQIASVLEDNAEFGEHDAARDPARRPARRDPAGDHRHQRRRRRPRAPGGDAGADPRLPARVLQRVPDDAPARREAVGRHRRGGPRLTLGSVVAALTAQESEVEEIAMCGPGLRPGLGPDRDYLRYRDE